MFRVLFIIMLIFTTNVIAGVYKCKNSAGKMTFSDTPCSGVNQLLPTQPDSQYEHTDNSVKSAYTKDIPAVKAQDDAIQACFDYINTTSNFPDPATTKLVSSSKKWVSVKGVGARQDDTG